MPGSRLAETKSSQTLKSASSRVSLSSAEHSDRIGGFTMSGIAGLVRFDGRTVMRRELERATNSLNQYGLDRNESIANDNVVLVHALMRMTPDDRFDRQPQRGASGSI